MADVVSAPARVGGRQRPGVHRAAPCAGTRRTRVAVCRRGGAPARAPSTVVALTAGDDEDLEEQFSDVFDQIVGYVAGTPVNVVNPTTLTDRS